MRPEENPRLVIEKAGHQVVLDHQGLAIDGERICRTPLTPSQVILPGQAESRAFQVTAEGQVIYRGRMVAEIGPSPAGTANPGELAVHGPNGPEWYPPDAGPSGPELAAAVKHAAELAARGTERGPEEIREVSPDFRPPHLHHDNRDEQMELAR
ncbi:hypothetical protein AB0E96_40825 [Kitasatospora sp. NPDC036755]|uniref:hypothetical protein n=1 Tax=Kitasatospora sp. NPDC036755 TaxID=3154600 RepID=UPI00340FFE3B